MTPTSFTIDHTKLLPGIYLQAEPGKVYTYELRFPKGDCVAAIKTEVMHTYEHCMASYLRERSSFKDNILYVGPMGCCSGLCLRLNCEIDVDTITKYLCESFEYILTLDQIPTANAQQCGNYLLNDLEGAKELAKELLNIFSSEINSTYPTL